MKTYFKLTLSMILCLVFAISVNAQQEQFGQASYYSDAYHGKKTASGQRYDKTKLTAAHNDFPFGSVIKVTHLGNKKTVTVKVTDRGPYIKGRIVDLSKAAAQKIGLITDGVAQVKVELVKDSGDKLISKGKAKVEEYSTAANRKKLETNIKKNSAANSAGAGGTNPPAKTKAPIKTKAKAAIAKIKTPPPAPAAPQKEVLAAKGDDAPTSLPMFTAQDMADSDLYQISLMKPKKEGFGVQVASFSDYENVLKKVAELQGKFFQNILIRTESADGKNIYKIILGQYETREQANSYKKDLKKKKRVNGFVIPLGEEE